MRQMAFAMRVARESVEMAVKGQAIALQMRMFMGCPFGLGVRSRDTHSISATAENVNRKMRAGRGLSGKP